MPRLEQGAAEQAEKLDRYWDDVILNGPDAIPDPELDAASASIVRRVEVLAAVPGSTAARERVWRTFQEAGVPSPTSQNGHIAPKSTLTETARPLPLAPTSPRSHRRRWHLIEFVAAALLLAILGGAIARSIFLLEISDRWSGSSSLSIPVSRGGPARTGEQPGPGPNGVPDVEWMVRTGDALSGSPVVVDGVLFVGTYTRHLLAVDAEHGDERWSFDTEGAIGGSAVVAEGIVYVGDEAGILYAVDAESGVERWRVDLGGSLYTASPVVVEGLIYVTSGAGGTAPAYDNGVVYVGGDGSASRSPLRVRAVDVTTGEERWRHDIAANGLFALDAMTGEEQWYFRTPAPIYHSSPVVALGTVYVGSKDGMVFAVDGETGREVWKVRTGTAVYASPAVVDGIVYVGSGDGFLYALDAVTGSREWRFEVGVVRRSSASVADGIVYVVGGDHLWAIEVSTGQLRWQTITGGDGDGSPVVIDGRVYVPGRISVIGDEPPDAIGVLYAFAEEGQP